MVTMHPTYLMLGLDRAESQYLGSVFKPLIYVKPYFMRVRGQFDIRAIETDTQSLLWRCE